MFRRIISLVGCLILIVLISCRPATNEPTPTGTPKDDKPVSTDAPKLVDVSSTGNNTVLLNFNKPMGKSVEDVSLYKIIRPQECDLKDWNAELIITKAVLNDDRTSVTLTTMAQTGVIYQLVVAGVSDQTGSYLTGSGMEDRLTFVGSPPIDVVDTDGDGVSDADEQFGWTVRIGMGDGTELCKYVTSDPMKRDTDLDGVEDNNEMAISTNPRSPDTDGDDLSDKMESDYFSSPIQQDTDQDGITDGEEAKVYKTSPALKDTDGDGTDDYEEIITGGRNPRLADLPKLDLQLYGDPAIVLNITEGKQDKQISSSLEQDRSDYQHTDNVSNRMSIENTINLHTETEVGTSNWPPSANAKLTTDSEFKHSYVNETSSSWTSSSVEDVKNTFEAETTATTTFHNGIISVSMKLVNNSNLSFKLKSPRVMAYRMTPGGNFSVVGSLEPGKLEISNGEQHWVPEPEANEYVIGPGGSVLLLLGAGDLPAQVMKPLMQNPTALIFEIGSYSLFQLDEFGVEETKSYDRVGENVLARTGLIVIDYGNGRVERYPIATNLRRNADGSGSGVTMKEALTEIIGLDYQNIDTPSGRSVLSRVGTEMIDSDGDGEMDRFLFETYPETEPKLEDRQAYGYWLVGGTQEIFQSGDVSNFDEIVIKSGDRVNLVWIEDQDGDGLTDREEYLLGTDLKIVDTDEDGLSDYDETRVGWSVEVKGQTAYAVLPDPRFADSDGDGWSDKYESEATTDPFLIDTDHDTLNDPEDLFPLSGACMQDLKKLGLVAWWIPSFDTEQKAFADDIWDAEGTSQFGSMSGYDPGQEGKDMILEKGGDQFFSLNRGINTDNQYIKVEHDKYLSPKEEFSIATWLVWDGTVASGVEVGTLITKGTNYTLYVTKDGGIKFTFKRRVWETCESTCPDKPRDWTDDVLTEPNIIKPNQEYHVVVTFGKNSEYIRIYLNGTVVTEHDAHNKHRTKSGLIWYTYREHTEWVYTNTEPLTIGNTIDGSLPFKGMVRDIQFFSKEMNRDDVEKLYKYGLCVPTLY